MTFKDVITMGNDFKKNDYYIFDRIDMRNLIASKKNICKPEWGEKNCIYSYNKFYYFLSGEGTIIINDDIFTPKPEEFYFIPANTKHSFSHNPKKNLFINIGAILTSHLTIIEHLPIPGKP